MKGLFKKTQRLRDFIMNDIWKMELEELSKARARFIKHMKVLLITIKTFSTEKIGFQAVALSFFSTMSVVPFIAIVFTITGGLGLADKLEEMLYTYFNNSEQVIETVLGFSKNIIDTAQGSVMGLVSASFFAFIVVRMMLNVERVFNNVWMVSRARNIFKRLGIIIAMLIISPFVVLVFLGGSILYSHALSSIGVNFAEFSIFKNILTWALFGVVAAFTFSLMYKFIPNAKVSYMEALRAAIITAIPFTIVQYTYLETQVLVTGINTVYGAFAAIPLFMVWINIGWYIILIGAELSYAFQHVDSYNIED